MKILYSLPPFLSLCGFIFLGILSLSQGKKNRINRIFTVICLLGTFLYTDILIIFNCASPRTALFISRLDHFFVIYLIPLYIHFFHVYLKIPGRIWLLRTAYTLTAILMCFTPTPWFIAEMQRHPFGYFGRGGPLYILVGIGAACAAVYVLILIRRAILQETQSILKNRLKYVYFGFGVLGLLIGMNTLPLLGYPVYPPGNFSFIPLSIFAIGLFRYDLLDMGILIRKSVIYSLLTITLTLLYALIVTGINETVQTVDASSSAYFHLFFFIVVTVIFGPVQSRIQTLVDRYFFKGRYDYRQTIKGLSQTIAAVLDLRQIALLVVQTISGSMQVSRCEIYLSNDALPPVYLPYPDTGGTSAPETAVPRNDPLIAWMENRRRPLLKNPQMPHSDDPFLHRVYARLETLGAAVVFPLMFEKTLNGFLVIGDKKSGDLFQSEDMDLLETLANQSALSIENARSYQKIEDLNTHLEKKVTERTQALQTALSEKEKAMERLIRSESLAAIGTLVAGTAHELNNPLASAMSLMQSVMEDLSPAEGQGSPVSPEILEDLAFAGRELDRAKAIVGSLLGLSRQNRAYTESVDLNAVVKDTLQVLRNLYKNRNIQIDSRFEADLPPVLGHFSELGQVVLNIIQNAIQAVPPSGGTLFLKTLVDRTHHQVIFECKDTGPGVADAIRQDIFKPFFTTKPAGQGTGLGLYICHDIVERHGGTLTLEKSHGKGARFVVKLNFKAEG